jgi:hypothetical protein
MASKQGELTAWASLPKAEQEKLRKQMAAMPEPVSQAKANGKGKSGFNLKGYVRCELAAADKDAFNAWEQLQEPGAVLGQLVAEVDSGYLLKLGEAEKGYQASLCAATTGREWEGFVLTAHASSGVRAAALLVYKHCVLMVRDWTAWTTDDGEDFLR